MKKVIVTIVLDGKPYITEAECSEKEIPTKKAELIKWAKERYKDVQIVDIKTEDVL